MSGRAADCGDARYVQSLRTGGVRRRLAGALLLAMACLVASCQSPIRTSMPPGPEIAPPQGDRGRLYFYRPDIPFLIALEPDIIVNGRKVGVSRVGTWFHKDASPGRYHVFLATAPENPVELTIAAGAPRFVKTEIVFTFLGFELRPVLVDEAAARGEMAELRYLEERT